MATIVPRFPAPVTGDRSVVTSVLSSLKHVSSPETSGSATHGGTGNPAHEQIAILDEAGIIIALTQPFCDGAQSPISIARLHVGTRYLELWSREGAEHPDAARVQSGIRSVLDGLNDRFQFEYAAGSAPHRLMLSIARLNGSGVRGAMVSHRLLSGWQLTDRDFHDRELQSQHGLEAQTEFICRFRVDTTITAVNDAYRHCFNLTRDQLVGMRFIELIPAASRQAALRFVRSLSRKSGPQTVEHQVQLPDGSVGWQQWVIVPIFGADGSLEEFQAVGRDISDRKQAEEALAKKEAALRTSDARVMDLAGRLIVAQENERTRIARELHDDFSQRIAAVSISLSGLRRHLPEAAVQAQSEVARLQEDVIRLSDEVRHLSHDLHPSILKHAGLVPTLRSKLERFQDRHDIQTSFQSQGDWEHLPPDLSICLYRITQEALRNVARHSGATKVRIRLKQSSRVVALTISDNGRGFERATAARSGTGLGLISIEERVHLQHGSLKIESLPRPGTTLRVRIPWRAP